MAFGSLKNKRDVKIVHEFFDNEKHENIRTIRYNAKTRFENQISKALVKYTVACSKM